MSTSSKYHLVFVQINEAHSERWPLGFSDHPTVQKNMEERVTRALEFKKENKFPYPLYIDKWSDDFENTYHAWPDQYCVISCDTGEILDMSRYSTDALIVNDYADLIEKEVSELKA